MTARHRIATRASIECDCATWPAELKKRWIALFDPDDAFAEKPWVRETQYVCARILTRYLACCARHGLPAQISSQGLRAFIRECEKAGNVPRTIAGYVWQLSHVANLLQPELYAERGAETAAALRAAGATTILLAGKAAVDGVDETFAVGGDALATIATVWSALEASR